MSWKSMQFESTEMTKLIVALLTRVMYLGLCSTALHGFHVCIHNVCFMYVYIMCVLFHVCIHNVCFILLRICTRHHACRNNQHVAIAYSKALFLFWKTFACQGHLVFPFVAFLPACCYASFLASNSSRACMYVG